MRKSLLVVALLLALPVIASAQDEVPKVEIFGGYSYLRLDNATGLSQQVGGVVSTAPLDRDANGFSASFTQNINSFLGITAEFSGHFTDAVGVNGQLLDRDAYFVTAGPRLAIRRFERFTPFLHIMAGMARQDVQNQNVSSSVGTSLVNQSDSGFAFVVGGGVDLNLSSRLGIRLLQADYILTRFSNRNGASSELNQANFRASTGFVLKLGEQ
jgi:opacity protein-like surface antigen